MLDEPGVPAELVRAVDGESVRRRAAHRLLDGHVEGVELFEHVVVDVELAGERPNEQWCYVRFWAQLEPVGRLPSRHRTTSRSCSTRTPSRSSPYRPEMPPAPSGSKSAKDSSSPSPGRVEVEGAGRGGEVDPGEEDERTLGAGPFGPRQLGHFVPAGTSGRPPILLVPVGSGPLVRRVAN